MLTRSTAQVLDRSLRTEPERERRDTIDTMDVKPGALNGTVAEPALIDREGPPMLAWRLPKPSRFGQTFLVPQGRGSGVLKHPAVGSAVMEAHASKFTFPIGMLTAMPVTAPSSTGRVRNDRGASTEREGVPVCVVHVQVGELLVDTVPTSAEYSDHVLSFAGWTLPQLTSATGFEKRLRRNAHHVTRNLIRR